jgi:hypothetical protein
VIWSSKTPDHFRREPHRRPVSVAERPPSSARSWRGASTTSTVTSVPNVGGWSFPDSALDRTSVDKIRRGPMSVDLANEDGQSGRSLLREHSQSHQTGEELLNSDFVFRNGHPSEGNRERRSSPHAVARRFNSMESLPLPTVGRRHSALSSPPTDLFLTRSGLVAAAGKDDVVEQMKRSKFNRDLLLDCLLS